MEIFIVSFLKGYICFVLGVLMGYHDKKNTKSDKCIIHNTDWHGKCFKCSEQVFTRESK
jgi:hypothetical protein